MARLDPKELLETLLKTGLTKEPSKFIPLENWNQLIAARACMKQMDGFCRYLWSLSKKLRRKYCKQVRKHCQDVNVIVALRQLYTCYEFYNSEFFTAKRMQDEYVDYLCHGHLFEAWAGETRDTSEFYRNRDNN